MLNTDTNGISLADFEKFSTINGVFKNKIHGDFQLWLDTLKEDGHNNMFEKIQDDMKVSESMKTRKFFQLYMSPLIYKSHEDMEPYIKKLEDQWIVTV